jgi:hypothetical protein
MDLAAPRTPQTMPGPLRLKILVRNSPSAIPITRTSHTSAQTSRQTSLTCTYPYSLFPELLPCDPFCHPFYYIQRCHTSGELPPALLNSINYHIYPPASGVWLGASVALAVQRRLGICACGLKEDGSGYRQPRGKFVRKHQIEEGTVKRVDRGSVPTSGGRNTIGIQYIFQYFVTFGYFIEYNTARSIPILFLVEYSIP